MREFYYMSPSGGRPDRRMGCSIQLDHLSLAWLASTRPIKYWPSPNNVWPTDVRVICDDEDTTVDDVPWEYNMCLIGSDKFKAELESADKNCAEFFPVRMYKHGREYTGIGPYWAVNILREIDCHDYAAQPLVPAPWDNKQMCIEGFGIIVPEKVPSEVMIFRIKYGTRMLFVRDKLRRALSIAKIKGPQYYLAWMSTDPDPTQTSVSSDVSNLRLDMSDKRKR